MCFGGCSKDALGVWDSACVGDSKGELDFAGTDVFACGDSAGVIVPLGCGGGCGIVAHDDSVRAVISLDREVELRDGSSISLSCWTDCMAIGRDE